MPTPRDRKASARAHVAVFVAGFGLLIDAGFAVAQQPPQPAQPGPGSVREACEADISSLCAGQSGREQIRACLKQNKAKLSPNCVQAIAARRAARRAAGGNPGGSQ